MEDYHTITYTTVYSEELGEYTLKCGDSAVKLNVTLPSVGFYSENETTAKITLDKYVSYLNIFLRRTVAEIIWVTGTLFP